jgi:DNA-binding response OmpR family regulator
MTASKPLAVVIEPSPALADTVADALVFRKFEVIVSTTHLGAAKLASTRHRVDFLAAAVPAPGEDRSGAYLSDARARSPELAVVIMLADPDEDISGAPPSAVRLVKPFSRQDLDRAVDQALGNS